MTRVFAALAAATVVAVFLATWHPYMAAVAVAVAVAVLTRQDRGPRAFPEWMRARILARSGGRCCECGRWLHWERSCPLGGCDGCFQADHVEAWANGGPTTLANGQALCRECNQRKGARL